jgi:hypothetical protein
MKKTNLCVIGVAIYTATFGTSLAQEVGDDGAAPAAAAAATLLSTESEPFVERYLVTYLKSRSDAPRSATVVTVTNQATRSCEVRIEWFAGFTPDTPACTTSATLAAGVTHDFCSRGLLAGITTCNSTCDPALTFTEGKAIVSSSPCSRIGVESRVYYTTGETSDTGVSAVSNPNIVRVPEGNRGD